MMDTGVPADSVGASALALGILVAPRSSLSDTRPTGPLEGVGMTQVPGGDARAGPPRRGPAGRRGPGRRTALRSPALRSFRGPAFGQLDDQCPLAVRLDRTAAGGSEPGPTFVGRGGGDQDREVLGDRSLWLRVGGRWEDRPWRSVTRSPGRGSSSSTPRASPTSADGGTHRGRRRGHPPPLRFARGHRRGPASGRPGRYGKARRPLRPSGRCQRRPSRAERGGGRRASRRGTCASHVGTPRSKARRPLDGQRWDATGVTPLVPPDGPGHDPRRRDGAGPRRTAPRGGDERLSHRQRRRRLIIVDGPTADLQFSDAERTKVVAEVQEGLTWLAAASPRRASASPTTSAASASIAPPTRPRAATSRWSRTGAIRR